MKALQWFNKYSKFIALGIIVILVLFSLQQCSKNDDLARENQKLKQTESILSNNLKVANDTMRYWKDKAGNSMSEISVLTATNDMLKNQYSDINAKYKSLLGKDAKNQDLIAYLTAQIVLKDQMIQYLKDRIAGQGSYILNDSTVVIDVGKKYDSLNYYSVNGCVVTSIKDNKITAGKVDLTTTVGLGLELGVSRDKKTGMASVTSRTAFPAKVSLGGITKIEEELNKKPSMYLGLAFVVGYGATLEKQPQLLPYLGVAAYLSPRWLTIKIHNK
jgi:hypothetical protein